jgi:phosphoglycolate phosphatase
VISVDVAVLDMAGTTVRDDGLVEEAFVAALGGSVEPAAMDYVRATMGQSKIAVFTHLLGDADRAAEANLAFEREYARRIDRATPVPGAVGALKRLRDKGIRTALTTGFSPGTQALLVDALGWRDLVDLWLAPADAGRGRPYPDLPLTALLRLGGGSVRTLLVAGDTTSDMESGVNAGAGTVVGVLTGTHDEPALRAAGATHVLGSVADLPDLLRI